MSDNWIVQNLENALETWNEKLAEIWQLITQSPEQFKGGTIWNAIVGIHGAVQAIGLALLVLFFVVGVMKTCGSFAELKRPEHALKVFIRFVLAKAAVTYGLELMNALCIVVVFRSVNSILSKGILRGGGDTRFLLAADMSTMWLVAVPLGALAGLTLKLPPFFTYLFLYSDQILKAFWCILRLRSGKWIKHVQGTADFGEIEEDEEEMR